MVLCHHWLLICWLILSQRKYNQRRRFKFLLIDKKKEPGAPFLFLLGRGRVGNVHFFRQNKTLVSSEGSWECARLTFSLIFTTSQEYKKNARKGHNLCQNIFLRADFRWISREFAKKVTKITHELQLLAREFNFDEWKCYQMSGKMRAYIIKR